MKNHGYIIGVIGAEVNNIEQREMLSGMIEAARRHSVQLIVLSNLYNRLEPETANAPDNSVYDLISGDGFDSFIIMSESFVNPGLRSRLREAMERRRDIPLIIAGAVMPEFPPERFSYINTSDRADIAALTDRIIAENGFGRLAFLSGPAGLETSRERTEGFREALEGRGITFDPSLVYDGDFWYSSGERLAEKYLSGSLQPPEALICANDYMAFGVLDAFAAAGEDIREHFALAGYEYIAERRRHMPLLTTYRRNRRALGAAAVDTLAEKLIGAEKTPFIPPEGSIVAGQTCNCGLPGNELREELSFARSSAQYAYWNLKSDLESRLTECRSFDEFITVMASELYMVRGACDIVLCLYEGWASGSDARGGLLNCRNIQPYGEPKEFTVRETEITAIAGKYDDITTFYINPLFFRERLLGYCAVVCDGADTYDDIYRHWVKSVSNGLEFLRLKADVRYLLQCSAVSPSYDGITGLFSGEGIRFAFGMMCSTDKSRNIAAVGIRLQFGGDAFSADDAAREMTGSIIAAADVVRRFYGSSGAAGRISSSELLLILPSAKVSAELLADAVYTELMYDVDFVRCSSGSQPLCFGMSFDSSSDFDTLSGSITAGLECLLAQQRERRLHPHFMEFDRIHRQSLREPLKRVTLAGMSRELNLNQNYFNRVYRQITGMSFVQDRIFSRLMLAKHLLLTTDEAVSSVSERCGYSDSKYFIRQFTANTGLTPKQYRSLLMNAAADRSLMQLLI